jgi:hypothetical protein
MTPGIFMTVAFIALAFGVGIFFGPAAREDPPIGTVRGWIGSLAFLGGMLAGACALFVYGHPVWAFLLGSLTGGMTTAILRDSLVPCTSAGLRRVLYVAALAAAALIARTAYHRAEDVHYWRNLDTERSARRVQFTKELEERQARRLRELRHFWTADPTRGVAEANRGALRMWLAVSPKIEIDAPEEKSLGARAQREVPLRVVWLNDSFLPVTPDTEAELTPLGWMLQIRDAQGGLLRAWEHTVSDPHALQPAERRDFKVTWDGRDGNGHLAAPGNYEVTVDVGFPDDTMTSHLSVEIEDAGEIVIVEEDPMTRTIRQQQEMMRWHRTLEEGMRLLDQQRAWQMQLQRWPR